MNLHDYHLTQGLNIFSRKLSRNYLDNYLEMFSDFNATL